MNFKKEWLQLYAVTDRTWVGRQTLQEQVESALKGGATCIQLREKELSEASFLEEAVAMKKICHRYGVPFIINDNVEIALKCGADGIHVGQSDMAAGRVRALVGDDFIIGVSARTVEQAVAAEQAGADYLGVGAVFSTATKQDAHAVEHQKVKEICAAVNIPIVAIGGINKENISLLTGLGVDGVALVSAVFAASDIEAECKALRILSEKMTRSI